MTISWNTSVIAILLTGILYFEITHWHLQFIGRTSKFANQLRHFDNFSKVSLSQGHKTATTRRWNEKSVGIFRYRFMKIIAKQKLD